MLPVYFLHRFQDPKVTKIALICSLVLGGSLMTSLIVRSFYGQSSFYAQTASGESSVVKLNGNPILDSEAVNFNIQTSMIQNANECFPIYLKNVDSIGVMYLYCSDAAQAKDGDAQVITDLFEAEEGIARRYNFWRRIYSLWGGNQYVMHSSQWPEVVIEALDGSNLPATMGPIARSNKIKKVAKTRRAMYKKLLLTMHKNRNTPERFTESMKRIARKMDHIKNDNKYHVAALTLRMQKGQRDFIASGLARAPKYLSHIHDNFKEIGVPLEISLLAFVESSFNLNAKSKVGASGVYQIMPATGKQYLKLHSGVDERNDPIKASRAAAKLLKLNYKILGEWPLAITAYNHGVGGVRRGVKKTGKTDIAELIEHYDSKSFKFASKNFYTSFLGILATIKDADRIFPQVVQPAPINFEEIKLRHSTSIATIRKKHDVSLIQIKEFNPDITKSVIRNQGNLPKGFVIKIPKEHTNSESDTKPVSLIPNS